MPGPWFLFVLISTWMVISCLRVIGQEYTSAVAWHDLRVRVQRLRRQQFQRLEETEETEPTLRRIARKNTKAVPSLVQATDPAAEAVDVLEAVAA